MIIRGTKLPDIDITELSQAEKWENELTAAAKKMEAVKSEGKLSETIKVQCHAIFDFLNNLFGEGTDRKVFGDKVNLLECVGAFDEVVTAVNACQAEAAQQITSVTAKYSPDRAARRKKQ